jgi:hypothetical protein
LPSLDRILEHRRTLERALGRDPGVDVAAASRRSGRPFALLRLTSVAPDQDGSQALLRDRVRECDLVVPGADGGLAVLLPETAGAGARALAERLRRAGVAREVQCTVHRPEDAR